MAIIALKSVCDHRSAYHPRPTNWTTRFASDRDTCRGSSLEARAQQGCSALHESVAADDRNPWEFRVAGIGSSQLTAEKARAGMVLEDPHVTAVLTQARRRAWH